MPVQRICATQGARAVLSCSGAPAQSKAASTASRGSRDRCTDASAPTYSAGASCSPTNDHGEHHESVPDPVFGWRYDRHAEELYRQALLTLGDAGVAEQYVRDMIVDEYRRPRRNGGTQRMQPVMSRYRPSGAARSWQRVRPGQLLVWPAAAGGVSAGAAHGGGAADGQYSGRGLRGDTR
jgi:hypothetical protein